MESEKFKRRDEVDAALAKKLKDTMYVNVLNDFEKFREEHEYLPNELINIDGLKKLKDKAQLSHTNYVDKGHPSQESVVENFTGFCEKWVESLENLQRKLKIIDLNAEELKNYTHSCMLYKS